MTRIVECTKTGDEWRSWRRAKWFEIPPIVRFMGKCIWYRIHYPFTQLWIDQTSGALLAVRLRHQNAKWIVNLCCGRLEKS